MPDELILSLDREGKNKLETIGWDSKLIATLIDGTKVELGAKAGQTITTSFFLVNPTPNRFGINELRCTDNRFRVTYQSAWILPNLPVKITLSYSIPENPTKQDIVKNARFIVGGFFVIE